MVSSDSKIDVETDVLDIVSSSFKKKIGGKWVPMNILVSLLGNVSFHFEESVNKWKFVCQRRIDLEKEMSEDTLDY